MADERVGAIEDWCGDNGFARYHAAVVRVVRAVWKGIDWSGNGPLQGAGRDLYSRMQQRIRIASQRADSLRTFGEQFARKVGVTVPMYAAEDFEALAALSPEEQAGAMAFIAAEPGTLVAMFRVLKDEIKQHTLFGSGGAT